ncbi:hypothetical protein SLS62_002599 [Diatrype stigma]|uniref:Ketoreductase domain-containing protein n=1 Tax=Diatrype stigma TaxID=117547 RepID=A0AAN9YUS7_9PEZI
MALTSRLAIIAGGLGGLGSATGKLLRAQGARLALLYAPSEENKKLDLLREGYGRSDFPGGEVRTYACDITSPASVQSAFSAITSDLGDSGDGAAAAAAEKTFPSILINSAGYVSLSPMEDTPPEETARNLNVNILGPMLCSQAFARLYMKAAASASASAEAPKAPPGRIVSVSSQAAKAALWHHGAYCASKAGLEGLTRSMASEWGPRGITANTVSPTIAWTYLGRKAWGAPGVADAFLKQIPTGRFVMPDEVAETIAFLCQDSSGMING